MGEIISLMMLAGVPILGVISMGYLLRCDEKRRQRMVRTAAVFLGALVLMIGGNFVLSFFGLAWRRTSWAVLLGTVLISSWVGISLVMDGFLCGEWLGVSLILRWVIKSVVVLLTGAVLMVSMVLFIFACALFGDDLGKVIEHQDQPLVEVDDGFLDSHYSYYAYYGPLVRGMERIWESPYPIKEGPG
ncbi:hypothetical protein [Lawsonibacter sp. JLR.KK007]|uniref:hypothetical protein n=1 Tax=Lawsonibacter sp. JLR.KK007 TaxID=3114293 RepID=UPI002FF38D0C